MRHDLRRRGVREERGFGVGVLQRSSRRGDDGCTRLFDRRRIGFQVVVGQVPEALATTIHVSVPPERRQDTSVKITLPVTDIAVTREVAQRLGGVVDPVERQWRFRGTS